VIRMHSAILYAVLPSSPAHAAQQIGRNFLAAISPIEGNESVRSLGRFRVK
jgi:hypothetical protein